MHGRAGLLEVVHHHQAQPGALGVGEGHRGGVPLGVLREALGQQPHGRRDQARRVEGLGHAQIQPVPVVLHQLGGRHPGGTTVATSQFLQVPGLDAELAHAVHELADLAPEPAGVHGLGDLLRPRRGHRQALGVRVQEFGDHRVLLRAGEQPRRPRQVAQGSGDAGPADEVEGVGGPGAHRRDGSRAVARGGQADGQGVPQARGGVARGRQHQQRLGVQALFDPARRQLHRHGAAARARGAQHQDGAVTGRQ